MGVKDTSLLKAVENGNATKLATKRNEAVSFPEQIQPMLATLADKPFDSPGWLYEVKWDGYRAMAFVKNKVVELKSRNKKSFNDKFYPITKALLAFKHDIILDGELVVLDKSGLPDFGLLQNWRSEADGNLFYYVFDVLWWNGRCLLNLPLQERKIILQKAVKETGVIPTSIAFEEGGIDMFNMVRTMGLEGIVAKRADSKYLPGLRSQQWLKIKTKRRQEMVIGGYTLNDDSSKLFSALLVGVFDNNNLIYKGKVGSGFNAKMQQEIMSKLKILRMPATPFSQVPNINKPSRFRPDPPHAAAFWVKPKLVCEVSFAEITSGGVMRHPSFQGLREDKNANNVVLEKERPIEDMVEQTQAYDNVKLIIKPSIPERKTLLNPVENTQVKSLNGEERKFTNLNKLFWPDEGISKRDLLNYYYQVAPYILPYLKDRPQSMNRHPNGIKAERFFYKDVTGKAPSWIKTYLYRSEGINVIRIIWLLLTRQA